MTVMSLILLSLLPAHHARASVHSYLTAALLRAGAHATQLHACPFCLSIKSLLEQPTSPTWCHAITQRGHAFRRLGEFEAAIQDYTQALALSPGNIKLHNNRAYCYAKIGCYSDATNDYNAVLALDPANSHALHNR